MRDFLRKVDSDERFGKFDPTFISSVLLKFGIDTHVWNLARRVSIISFQS